jgi:hypothetical protein
MVELDREQPLADAVLIREDGDAGVLRAGVDTDLDSRDDRGLDGPVLEADDERCVPGHDRPSGLEQPPGAGRMARLERLSFLVEDEHDRMALTGRCALDTLKRCLGVSPRPRGGGGGGR